MSNDNVEELNRRLQNLSVQRTYAEESLKYINQEDARVEHQLRVARCGARHNRAIPTNSKRITRDTNTFHIRDTIRITNKYCVEEQGAKVTVISVNSCYVDLRNKTPVQRINNNGAIWYW